MSDQKKQLTPEQQDKIKSILMEAVLLATKIETLTKEAPNNVYYTALAMLVITAKEDPGYEVAERAISEITDFAKKMSTN